MDSSGFGPVSADLGPVGPGVRIGAESASDRQESRVVSVAGVALPAGELSEALRAYATARLLDDRGRRSGQAFRSAPWAEAVRRLSAGAHLGACSLPPGGLVSCAEYAAQGGALVAPSTVRRWCIRGAVEGAVKVGGRWLLPVGAVVPTRRKHA